MRFQTSRSFGNLDFLAVHSALLTDKKDGFDAFPGALKLHKFPKDAIRTLLDGDTLYA